MVYALDTNQAENIGVGTIVAVVVVGLFVSFVISAIIGRILVLVLTVALGLLIWNQRAQIGDAAKRCDATFFGVHLTIDDATLKAKCQEITSR